MKRQQHKAYRDLNRGLHQMNRTTSITFNGKEVHNPILRKLVVMFAVVFIPLFLVIGLALLIVMLPVMLVLHPIFRLFGRVGTVRSSRGNLTIKLDKDSFRRG